MLRDILLYTGSIIVVLWGIAHIVIPTKTVVEGFGPISVDNRHILTMEWIMEGLTLCFIGILVTLAFALGGAYDPVTKVVLKVSSVMLFSMAIVSIFTGARTPVLPMRLCPVIFVSVALIYWLTSLG